MKKIIVFITLLIFSLSVFLIWEGLAFMSQSLSSINNQKIEKVLFEVENGDLIKTVAKKLEGKNLITSEFKFFLMARVLKKTKIRIGEYNLNTGMLPEEILDVLLSGQSVGRTIVIQEGLNKFEIAKIFEKNKLCTVQEFLSYVNDPVFIKKLLLQENLNGIDSLEGYLFPETYQITKYTEAKDLIRKMVKKFRVVYAEIEKQKTSRTRHLTRQEIITMASIVEKETGAPEERRVISSVYHNRLEKPMRLQADPTVLYGIWVRTKKFKKNLTRKDLKEKSPYSTYTMMGLPKGPIANPGKEALYAAVSPLDTPYFYFVSRNDGTHFFSENYESHLKAIRAFQLNRKARKGKSWRMLQSRRAPLSVPANSKPKRVPAKTN